MVVRAAAVVGAVTASVAADHPSVKDDWEKQSEVFGDLQRLFDKKKEKPKDEGPPPETMRRLSRTLVDLHGGQLRDDASQVLIEWRGGAAQEIHRRFAGG